MPSLEETILLNYGGYKNNNLLEILQLNDFDIEYNECFSPSPYHVPASVIATIKQKPKTFTVISLNCQSINAKFDKLILFLEELRQSNIEFSIICLQETWLGENHDLSVYQIQNYSCTSQNKQRSQHGGLITYVHHDYNYTQYSLPHISNIWEGLFIKINNNQNNSNINIRKYSRIAETSATLIDNVFTNCDNKNLHTAGIIITDISDHFPYFYMIKLNKGYLNPPKFVFNRKFSKENLDSLMSELQSINIMNLLDKNLNNDPQIMIFCTY